MGASSSAIFDDDVAADVRAEWRDAILDGLEADEATARVLAEFAEALEHGDDAKVVWMALAAAQMETGRLQDDVRDRALSIIDAGGDVERWTETTRRTGEPVRASSTGSRTSSAARSRSRSRRGCGGGGTSASRSTRAT